MDVEDTIIIGSGSAGLTAGIYASRSGLKTVMIDKGIPGGQAVTAPWIENFPGFEKIEGMKLMELMTAHAENYLEIKRGELVTSIERIDDLFSVSTSKDTFHSKTIIIATGAAYKRLDIPGENRLLGKGVSYCATCDGFFFKGKKVAVIGGGNNAVTEAIFLNNLGSDVTIIHRRDILRAESALRGVVEDKGMQVMYNTTVEEILGDQVVEGLMLKNYLDTSTYQKEFDGVFISIGEDPQTDLALRLNVEVDKNGYIKTDKTQRTSIPFVYAAGDVTGGLRQIITACAEGAIAANSAFEDLIKPYWVENDK